MTTTSEPTLFDMPAPDTGLEACRFVWDSLSRHEARALWTELTNWVDWLRDTYQLDTKIKSCWYRHSPVLYELTALMAAHKAVYLTEPDARDAYREDLTAWHTQWMRASVAEIAKQMADCTLDGCAYTRHRPVVDTEMAAFITADVARRSTTAPVGTSMSAMSDDQMSDLVDRGLATQLPPTDHGQARVESGGTHWHLNPLTNTWEAQSTN
ncbi:hypothetical protein [Nocardia tengchongensis]|uniref:hypothetical protein n=1 Tax=Nocardia tengchongensis TaxID=2055889 RepID=UPI0036AB8CB4